MLNVRKLAAFDMAVHGKRFIVGEFMLGVMGPIALGIFSLLRGREIMGWYLIGLGTNYIPLLLYAVDIARKDSARQEAAYELEHKTTEAKRYGLGQFIILVPFLLVFVAVYQEFRKGTKH
jgi:hypothetical protein